MPKHFRDWRDQADARKAVAEDIAASVGAEGYRSNFLYIEKDDNWQDGAVVPAWHPDPSVLSRIRNEARAYFTPVPTAKECVAAEVDALTETEPLVEWVALEPATPRTPEAETQAEEAALLKGWVDRWWDDSGFWTECRTAVRYATWAARGGLRRRLLPSAYDRVERGGLTVYLLRDGMTEAEAFAQVDVAAPLPEDALLYTDPDTKERCAIVLFHVGEGAERLPAAELWFADRIEGVPVTVRRILVQGRTDYDEETIPQMAGRLPLAEIRAELLMTEPVRLQQRRRDFSETQLGRTTGAAASRERYTTNIDKEVVWTLNKPEGPPLKTWTDPETGTVWYGIPVPAQLGAGMRTDLQGREIEDVETGKKTLANPTVVIADPVDTKLVTHACHHARATILETCHQMHALESDKSAESGYSKRQSRARFETRVKRKKQVTERTIATTLNGVVADAALLATGTKLPDLAKRYRASVTLHVNTGPISSEEVKEQRESVNGLMLPRGDGMTALGVEDTKTAHEQIMADPVQRLIYREMQGKVFDAFVQNGTLDGAIVAAEIDGELAEKLRTTDSTAGAL